jgi:hypothetical protein
VTGLAASRQQAAGQSCKAAGPTTQFDNGQLCNYCNVQQRPSSGWGPFPGSRNSAARAGEPFAASKKL